ncbi:MAG: OadG family transporter subunit [Christensenellaceae bacterium]|jgi:sodium pump decarboxylase gamma subunit
MGNTMTMAEKAELAGMTTGLGLLVVFSCLILIILVVVILSKILAERKKAPKDILEKTIEAAAPPQAQPTPAAATASNDSELVAVLTAAVMAAMEASGTPAHGGLYVRSYKRIKNAPAWERAGKTEQIYNKF